MIGKVLVGWLSRSGIKGGLLTDILTYPAAQCQRSWIMVAKQIADML